MRDDTALVGLQKRKESAHGQERADRQHTKGKLTAWERICLLMDEGSFVETNMFLEHQCTYFDMDKKRQEGDGVITGYGKVNGRTVCVYAQDFTFLGGSISEENAKKIAEIQKKALKMGVPIIGLIDSSGARIQEGIHSLSGHGHIFFQNVQSSGKIPQISAIMGSCAGGASYSPALTDFVFMVRRSGTMFITGPKVVREAIGEEVSMEELGGTEVHAQISGMADYVLEDDVSCVDHIKQLLGYLPDNCRGSLPVRSNFHYDKKVLKSIKDVFPYSKRKTFDVRKLISLFFDRDSIFELKPEFAKNIVTAFARICGHPVGIVANQSMNLSGCIDINAADKAARFIRMCDSFNLPIITFVDVPGFLPGKAQEHQGIIRHGAKMLYAYSEAETLKITFILRKGYGGAYLAMCSKELGADQVYAWPGAEIAVMGAEAAVDVIFHKESTESKERRTEEYTNRFLNPDEAVHAGCVDEIIEPEQTRDKIVQILMLYQNENSYSYKKKKEHGNIPL